MQRITKAIEKKKQSFCMHLSAERVLLHSDWLVYSLSSYTNIHTSSNNPMSSSGTCDIDNCIPSHYLYRTPSSPQAVRAAEYASLTDYCSSCSLHQQIIHSTSDVTLLAGHETCEYARTLREQGVQARKLCEPAYRIRTFASYSHTWLVLHIPYRQHLRTAQSWPTIQIHLDFRQWLPRTSRTAVLRQLCILPHHRPGVLPPRQHQGPMPSRTESHQFSQPHMRTSRSEML
jgi:hypothetical protein